MCRFARFTSKAAYGFLFFAFAIFVFMDDMASSKAAMAELLDVDGKAGTVGAELVKIKDALTGNNGIKSIVDGVANGATAADLDIKAKFKALSDAVTASTDAINEKLESGDLTQLDTSNLKALRSSISDIQSQLESSFTDLGLKFNDANTAVPLDKLKKLQEALDGGVFKSNTELD